MRKLARIFSLLLCVVALNFLIRPYSAWAALKGNSQEKNTTEKDDSKIPKLQQILVLLESDLNTEKSQKGDVFSAEIMDDVLIDNNTVLIQKGSRIYGQITKVRKSTIIYKKPYIKLSVDTVENPSGQIITLDKPFKTEIYPPGSEKFKEKMLKDLPATIASSGSSFVLGQSSAMAKNAVWGISTGAGIAMGFISGFIIPNKNQSKTVTGMKRAFDSTPAGTLTMLIKKEKNLNLEPGQFLNIYFAGDAIRQMAKNFSVKDASAVNKDSQEI